MKKPLMRMFALCLAVLLLLEIFPFAFAEEHSTDEVSATENTSATLDPTKADTKNNNPEGYVYKSGIIWGADSSKEFDAVYNDIEQLLDQLTDPQIELATEMIKSVSRFDVEIKSS